MATLNADFFSGRKQSPTSPQANLSRHPNYNRVKHEIAMEIVAGEYYTSSCRELMERIHISKSSINRHLNELVVEGWLQKIVLRDGVEEEVKKNRTVPPEFAKYVRYKIIVSKDVANQYRLTHPLSTRKKKK